MADPTDEAIRSSMFTRQTSTRHNDGFFSGAGAGDDKLRPQMSRPNSERLAAAIRVDSLRGDSLRLDSMRRDPIPRERAMSFRGGFDGEIAGGGAGGNSADGKQRKDRQMSAREAVAAQEAAEAAVMAREAAIAAAAAKADLFANSGGGGGGGTTVTMSLMDLLEETDRQMGLEGSTYRMDDDDEYEYDDEYDDDDEYGDEDEEGEEHDCCVCMVKHRCVGFEPCEHFFCKKCSRELTVSKGDCPLCSNFILEILEVF